MRRSVAAWCVENRQNTRVSDVPANHRLLAILAADGVGYSRLMSLDDRQTVVSLDAARAVFRKHIEADRGRVIDMAGDSVLAAFDTAIGAANAAMAVQRELDGSMAATAPDRRLRFRIGLHLGDVIEKADGTVYGDGVNIAARLQGLTDPGGITVSESVHTAVRGKVGAMFEDLGEQTVKNIAHPVRAYRVRADFSAASPSPSIGASAPDSASVEGVLDRRQPDRLSIAILPFANLGEDQAQGFFSDGITEDIITELSRWRMLSVRSRSASFRYRGMAVDMKLVAHEMNVRFIVEGSVRRMGDRLRITTQLIDAQSGNHIWAEKFDLNAADIFAVQDQVVRTIVGTLVGRVQASDHERIRRKPPASLAAYECVLKGNALSWDDPEGAAEATRLFERAIEIDPGYGFAHALLAIMWSKKWFDDSSGSDAALNEAYAMATRAVKLDENESTCHSILAQVHLDRHAFDLALQCARRSVELNPTNQWNAADMGSILIYVGQAEHAMIWFKRAKEIDPYFDAPWYWYAMGRGQMILHRHEEALATFDHLPTRNYRVSALVAACHARMGNHERARLSVSECLASKPDFSIRYLMTKEPFKHPADATHLADGLRLAGLPD